MNCRFLSVGAAVLTVAVVNVRVDAVTVTIEHGTEYQTMLGFGGHDPRGDVSTLVNDLGMSVHRAEIRPDGYNGPNYATFGGMHPWWTNGPFYTADFLKLIIDTIGFSIIRTEFYPRPDQADMFTKLIPFLRAVLQKSDESGADVRIIASVWTPPASLKGNNSTTAGSLRDGQESALADYLVTYLQYYKEQVGRDLFALSPQNEPQIGTGYNSCPYWPAQLAEVIVALGPKVKTANLPTRVFFSDDICCWYDWNNQVQTGIQGNRVADSVASIRAMHYAADDDNGSIQVFQQYGTGARQLGKQAWNTEFGNGSDSWDGAAWKNTKDMYYMLRYGFSGIVTG